MPPRYAYWTILIDQKPTAFRARERDEILPTLHQLRRKNTDVVLKWFARGRLWESPEQAQAAQRAPKPPLEKRGRDWRPGGEHRDPRDRFKKRSQARGEQPGPPGDRGMPGSGKPPWRDRQPPGAGKPAWRDRQPPSAGKPARRDRPGTKDAGAPRAFGPAGRTRARRDNGIKPKPPGSG